MFRITSQLCEVFDCTDQQLEESGKIKQFKAWLKNQPHYAVSYDVYYGEMLNGELAVKFFEFYKNLNTVQ